MIRGSARRGWLVGAVPLSGCAAPAATPQLQVSLEQSRDNENRHLLQVVLDNAGPDDPLLARLRRRECDLEQVADAAGLSFADDAWGRTGLIATGRAVVRRGQGSEPVEMASLEGTVVFTLRGQGLPAVLADQDRVDVPVTVSASRCDVHALLESKRSYDFQAAVRLGDGELMTVTVQPGRRGLALLERLLADTCAPRE